jgi:[protein-PII] uridylyltransferase
MDSPRSQLGKLAPPGAVADVSTPPPPVPETLRSEGGSAGSESGAICSDAGALRAQLDRDVPDSSTSLTAKSEAMLKSLSTNLVPELRRYVAVHRQEIERLVKEGDLSTGLTAGQRYSKIVDGLLSSLLYTTRAVMFPAGNGPRVALVAVGSYGRRTLSVHSDLDVRLLSDADLSAVRPLAEALLYPLWDAGLNIGHQVICREETIDLARSDLPTATSLLDFRHIAGDEQLTQALMESAFEHVFGGSELGAFLARLERSAHERHERFGGSVFLLEPDVKNGTGGLRDLDVARWAARARFRIEDFEGMVRVGALAKREWRDISLAWRFLSNVRNHLHLTARRRADRLIFEQQERVALAMGYAAGGAGVELFMSDYYRHARSIELACRMSIARSLPVPSDPPHEEDIGGGFKLINGRISLVDKAALKEDPALAIRVYRLAVDRDTLVDDATRQAIVRACASKAFCSRLRRNRSAGRAFADLVKVVQTTQFPGGSILRELHEVGLLVAMIPEFLPVVGRVHHDIYHVYTVDVHSVAAVDRLRALCRGDMAAEEPLACRLAADMARPNVLFFAALLHDIGKDHGGQNHSERGATLCPEILERLGFDEAEIEEVQHLTLKHLRMYHVATRRDIDDPHTIREFCAELHGQEGLNELYLLTVADVSTTSPTALTAWKSRMLNELYVAAERWFGDGPPSRGLAYVARVREQVRALLPDRPGPAIDVGFADRVLNALPPRYVYANAATGIVKHLAVIAEAQGLASLVRELDTSEPYLELAIVADDRPGLLSYIAASLAACKIKVIGAQIYSFEVQGGPKRAVDMFWVRAGQESGNARRLLPKVQQHLADILAGKIEPTDLVRGEKQSMRWNFRPAPAVATEIFIDNRSATRHTVVEVITQDRRDLLFWLSAAMHREDVTIDLAKINTEGERVADVFYVTNRDGSKLEPDQVERVERRIQATLAMIEGDPEKS